ncbi:04378a54-d700-4c3a-ab5d-2bad458ee0c1 [Sclerotinia trifoliorum]|uniref:04378a54-d700-4c3a-ab5d-2bad458ee0c1 n=1 Tax=Sclerotinia trifoliorum TaxID=28548 RepID=A0A8H2W0J5_9HELO|nr:04378a54-d700-4c3a-ab5d-2bad458ee0c1 [Sclerotinia trifoliorum]
MADIELKVIQSSDRVENGSDSDEAAESEVWVNEPIPTRSRYADTCESKKQRQIQDEIPAPAPTPELQRLVSYSTRSLEEGRYREEPDEQKLQHDSVQLTQQNSVTGTSDVTGGRKGKSCWSPKERFFDHPANEFLPVHLPEVALFIRSSERFLAGTDMALGDSLQIDDLDTVSLKTIGNLEIFWTDYIGKHLSLDPATRKLYLAWTRMEDGLKDSRLGMSDISPFRPGQSPLSVLNENIAVSWGMIFSKQYTKREKYFHKVLQFLHLSEDRKRKLKRQYEKISFDDSELSVFHGDYLMFPWQCFLRNSAHMTVDEFDMIRSYHATARGSWISSLSAVNSAQNKFALKYSDFGLLEDRVRQLRHYMDNQKPRGIRQLWRDRRDALNYSTFCG